MLSLNHTRAVWLALVAFLLLSLAQTWPLVSAPAHWSRTDPGDGALNTWAVSWVGHNLLHPSKLFDANIFYPEHLTLAYSEAMIVQGMIAAPVLAAGGSPVLAYNVALLAGMTLTGWAFCLLLRSWTGSWWAGYLAGSLAAFNAFSLAHITHMQFQHVEFVAAILFAVDRLIVTGGARYIVALALAVAAQAYASIYVLVFASWVMVFAAVGRMREWLAAGGAVLMRFTAAASLAVAFAAPYLFEYRRVHQLMGFTREVGEAEPVRWANFLATTARLHYAAWSERFVPLSTANMFPGVVALCLVIVAWSHRRNRADARFRMCGVAALGCIAVAAAPWLPFYRVLHDTIPLFQIVRQLADIGQIVLLMVAVLAGFGFASAQERWGASRWWPAAALAMIVAVNAEATRAPMGFVWFDGVPPVYQVLAKEPSAVVVELPFPMPKQWFLNTPYMVNSTAYWRPLLNGYSGFLPASYAAHYDLLRKFPSDEALIELSKEGVTHVVVHQRAMNQGGEDSRYNPFENIESLQLITRDDDVLIYRLRGR